MGERNFFFKTRRGKWSLELSASLTAMCKFLSLKNWRVFLFRVIIKKVSFGISNIMNEKRIYNGKQRQSTIYGQAFKIFGHCQNRRN